MENYNEYGEQFDTFLHFIISEIFFFFLLASWPNRANQHYFSAGEEKLENGMIGGGDGDGDGASAAACLATCTL